ncbi:hypothetical protein [Pseudochrobactrum saccharolyticum]|uniref:hypothetical protein n=1 Tax=Pseudochrobactrum saccharolyticum TaxID=354352 RepID=UPI0027735E7B|nr:hypothetical protein [Pseudochrobactrum saccharolyticum]MDP8251550.1 hypothetical protein [Pseudochrobactrum saccharolyticum]
MAAVITKQNHLSSDKSLAHVSPNRVPVLGQRHASNQKDKASAVDQTSHNTLYLYGTILPRGLNTRSACKDSDSVSRHGSGMLLYSNMRINTAVFQMLNGKYSRSSAKLGLQFPYNC